MTTSVRHVLRSSRIRVFLLATLFVTVATVTLAWNAPTIQAANYPVADSLDFPDPWIIIRGGGEFKNVRGKGIYHLGIDTAGDAGDPIFSIGNGVVKHIGVHSRFGTLVLIEHRFRDGSKFVSQYGHLRTTRDMPKVGDVVVKGEYIGQLGAEGEENGYWSEHLHFGIRPGAFVPIHQGWVYWGMGNEEILREWVNPDTFIKAHLSGDADPQGLAKFAAIPGLNESARVQSYAPLASASAAAGGAGAELLEDASFFGFSTNERTGGDIAVGDVTGDKDPEIIVGAGAGSRPMVRIFDRQRKKLLGEFLVYADSFRGGVRVTTANMDGKGKDEIVVGTGVGGGTHVRVFSGVKGKVKFGRLFPFAADYRTGIDVAGGDIDGDGKDEIVVGTGQGEKTAIRIFDNNGELMKVPEEQDEKTKKKKAAAGSAAVSSKYPEQLDLDKDHVTTKKERKEALTIHPYAEFRGGVRVAVGDIDADGVGEILAGAGPGGGPHLRVFEADGTPRGIQFFPFHVDFRGGIDVGSTDWNDDGKDDLIVSQTSGGQGWVKVYRYNDEHTILAEFNAFGEPEVGANVAGFK